MTLSLNTTDFIIQPSTVKAYGSMLIRVQNKTVLDYEERQHITFKVGKIQIRCGIKMLSCNSSLQIIPSMNVLNEEKQAI